MYWADSVPWAEDPPELREVARDQGLAWALLVGAIGILVAPDDPHPYFRAIDAIPLSVLGFLAVPLAVCSGPLGSARWFLAERLARENGGVAVRLVVRGPHVAGDFGALWLDGALLRFRGIKTEFAIPASLSSWFRRDEDTLRIQVDRESVAFQLIGRDQARVREILEAWPRSRGEEEGALTPDLTTMPEPFSYAAHYAVPVLLGLGAAIGFATYAFHLPPTTQAPTLLTASLTYLASYAIGIVQLCRRWRRTQATLAAVPLPPPTPIEPLKATDENELRA